MLEQQTFIQLCLTAHGCASFMHCMVALLQLGPLSAQHMLCRASISWNSNS